MNFIVEAMNSLYGSWRLLRWDQSGMQRFDATIEGYWRSFSVIAVVLALEFTKQIIFSSFLVSMKSDGHNSMVYELISRFQPNGYDPVVGTIIIVVPWIIFPFMMFYVSEKLDRKENYLSYIVSYNWSSLIKMFVVFVVTMIQIFIMSQIENIDGSLIQTILGIVMLGISLFSLFAISVVSIVYPIYVAKVALNVKWQVGMGVFALDIAAWFFVILVLGSFYS